MCQPQTGKATATRVYATLCPINDGRQVDTSRIGHALSVSAICSLNYSSATASRRCTETKQLRSPYLWTLCPQPSEATISLHESCEVQSTFFIRSWLCLPKTPTHVVLQYCSCALKGLWISLECSHRQHSTISLVTYRLRSAASSTKTG